MEYEKNAHGQLLHPEKGYPICGEGKKHPNKYGDYICLNHPMRGRKKCKFHGGASLRGAEHPNFKDGARSSFMPVQLAVHYQDSLDDPDLMDLRHIVALRQAFIKERLIALKNAPDPVVVWQQLTAQLNALEVAYTQADPGKMRESLNGMRALIGQRRRYHQLRNEIEGSLDRQRQDIAQYETILHKGDNAIPVAEVITLFASFSAFIMREFADDQRRMTKVLDYVDSLLIGPG